MLGSTPAALEEGPTRFPAATGTMNRMPKHTLTGELSVRSILHSIPLMDMKIYDYCTINFCTIDVKMDWCNTKVDGKQLDPKDQYPQMVNISYLPAFYYYKSGFYNMLHS